MKNTNGTNQAAVVLFPSTCINMLVNLLSCEIFKLGHPLVPPRQPKKALPAPGSSEETVTAVQLLCLESGILL